MVELIAGRRQLVNVQYLAVVERASSAGLWQQQWVSGQDVLVLGYRGGMCSGWGGTAVLAAERCTWPLVGGLHGQWTKGNCTNVMHTHTHGIAGCAQAHVDYMGDHIVMESILPGIIWRRFTGSTITVDLWRAVVLLRGWMRLNWPCP